MRTLTSMIGVVGAIAAGCGCGPRAPREPSAPADERSAEDHARAAYAEAERARRERAAQVDAGVTAAPAIDAAPAAAVPLAERCRAEIAATGAHAPPDRAIAEALRAPRWCGTRRDGTGLIRYEVALRADGTGTWSFHVLGPDGRGGFSESSRGDPRGCWFLDGAELWWWPGPTAGWQHHPATLASFRLRWDGVEYAPCAPADPTGPPPP